MSAAAAADAPTARLVLAMLDVVVPRVMKVFPALVDPSAVVPLAPLVAPDSAATVKLLATVPQKRRPITPTQLRTALLVGGCVLCCAVLC